MTKPERVDNGAASRWRCDGGECSPLKVPACSRLLVHVQGDLGPNQVLLRGGLTEADVLLETVLFTPVLIEIPPVGVLVPEAPAGITITVKGVP
jgi:hypothetical protein